jgi:WD40 repeat protein
LREIEIFERPMARCDPLCFKGAVVAFAPIGDPVTVVDVGRDSAIRSVGDAEEVVTNVSLSDDARYVAVAILGGLIGRRLEVWDVRTEKRVLVLRRWLEVIGAAGFAPDCRTLAVGGIGKVELRSVENGKLIMQFRGDGLNCVSAIAFSADGETVAAGADSGAICVWDVGTGRVLQTLKGHQGQVTCIAFGPGGATLVSGSSDSTALVWRVRGKAYRRDGWLW